MAQWLLFSGSGVLPMLKQRLIRIVALCATIATGVAISGSAEAQSGYSHYRAYGYAQHYQPVPYGVHRYAALPPPRWQAGLHFTGISVNHKIADEGVVLGGLGVHLRYRGFRWGAELALDVVGNEFNKGAVTQASVPIQANALLYLLPRGRFNLYLLGGLRVVATRIDFALPGLHDSQNFAEFGMQGGIGGELLLGRYFALVGDVRAFGQLRDDNDPSGAYYDRATRPVIPSKSRRAAGQPRSARCASSHGNSPARQLALLGLIGAGRPNPWRGAREAVNIRACRAVLRCCRCC